MLEQPYLIEPTDTAFDDSADFFILALSNEGRAKLLRDAYFRNHFRVVHGVCMGADTHKPYVHAWVEADGRAWQAGFVDNTRVYFALELADFYEAFRVQWVLRYTIEQAVVWNVAEGSTGPWDAELQRMIRAQIHGEIVGHVTGPVPVAIVTAREIQWAH